jgi:hypothetical protein
MASFFLTFLVGSCVAPLSTMSKAAIQPTWTNSPLQHGLYKIIAGSQAEDMGENGQCVCIIGTSGVATVC